MTVGKVFEFIKNREQELLNQGRYPAHVLDIEISKAFGQKPSQELKQLVKTERIQWGETINHIYFKTNQ